MKKSTLTFILTLSAGFQHAYAQEQDASKVTSAQVFKISEPVVAAGYLYQLSNHTVSLSSSPLLSSPDVVFHEINVQDIQKIAFKKKRGAGQRFLVGALSGFAIGGILGYAIGSASGGGSGGPFSIDPFSPEEEALMSGILFGIGGGIIYTLAGSKITIRINGNKETYYKKHRKLKKHLLPAW